MSHTHGSPRRSVASESLRPRHETETATQQAPPSTSHRAPDDPPRTPREAAVRGRCRGGRRPGTAGPEWAGARLTAARWLRGVRVPSAPPRNGNSRPTGAPLHLPSSPRRPASNAARGSGSWPLPRGSQARHRRAGVGGRAAYGRPLAPWRSSPFGPATKRKQPPTRRPPPPPIKPPTTRLERRERQRFVAVAAGVAGPAQPGRSGRARGLRPPAGSVASESLRPRHETETAAHKAAVEVKWRGRRDSNPRPPA